MLLGKAPDGHYKLSREAILAAELPTVFTARSNWRGPLPKELLCVFCRLHRLLEPLFSVKTIDSSETLPSDACKKIKLPEVAIEAKMGNGLVTTEESLDKSSAFKCEVKILSRRQDVVLECFSDNTYKKESDAIQNVALKVLTWFSEYFKNLDLPIEKLTSFALAHNVIIHPINFSREFATLVSIYDPKQSYRPHLKDESGVILFNVEGDDSGVFPSHGSLACISYVVKLAREGEPVKEVIESKVDFEFEIGTGAAVSQLEAAVTQLSVNQAAQFITVLPSRDLLFAAASQSAKDFAKLSLGVLHAISVAFLLPHLEFLSCNLVMACLFLPAKCSLEYYLKVLGVTEPLEDRMEQALFSPPLSKQRVEFAVRHINESRSTSLVTSCFCSSDLVFFFFGVLCSNYVEEFQAFPPCFRLLKLCSVMKILCPLKLVF